MAGKSRPLPVKAFALELAIYAPLVSVYLVFVLGWVQDVTLYIDHFQPAWVYALLALALMLGQALGLEIVTGWLVRIFGGRKSR